MKRFLRALMADHGMILVLLALCGFFSVLTVHEQSPTGAAAGRALAQVIPANSDGRPTRVLIAVTQSQDDASLAAELERELRAAGAEVVAVVKGEPRDARTAIRKLSDSQGKLDVIAGTRTTGGWLLFADLKSDFPSLGQPVLVVPRSYRWPDFLKSENLLNITNQIAVIAIVAIGMTLVIISGGIDLSVGSLIALSAVIATWLVRNVGGGTSAGAGAMAGACLVAIVVCGIVGLFTGSMITRFNVPPFIVTLAMMLVGSGLAYIISRGQSIYEIPESFIWLGRGSDLFDLPNSVVLMLILYVVAHLLLSRTRLGRYLYAVGGNPEAARLAGVRVDHVRLFAYASSAVLAGLGGVVMASQLKSGSATYGNMYELYVIAAVVVGGTSLSGGQGNMLGTLIGAFTIAVIQNGMNLMNIESYTQKVVLGLVILGAVLFEKLRQTNLGSL